MVRFFHASLIGFLVIAYVHAQSFLDQKQELEDEIQQMEAKIKDAVNGIRSSLELNLETKRKELLSNLDVSRNIDSIKRGIRRKCNKKLTSEIRNAGKTYERDIYAAVQEAKGQMDVKKMRNQLNEMKAVFEDDFAAKINMLEAMSGDEDVKQKQKKLESFSDEFYKLAKFAQAIQFHEEEIQRTAGQSGIKQIRAGRVGSRNYHSATHTSNSFSSIHDHSNNARTVGMGEFIGVLNGIEFRTRHNDYRLNKPAFNNLEYGSWDPVTFPPIPESVSNKPSIPEQIAEMREYFKAWINEDTKHRDFRKYFRPVLVYLEGAWTVSDDNENVRENTLFDSDRHNLDADNWLDLQDRIRFTSYTGSKSLLENLAHLPTKIVGFDDSKRPIFGRFTYRLMCHEVKKDIPLTFFEPRFDIGNQRMQRRDNAAFLNSRSAHFDLAGINADGKRERGAIQYNFLDSIMEEIPGKNNYGAEIYENAFDGSGDKLYTADPQRSGIPLNLGYYHRTFIQKSEDGKQKQDQRSFSDSIYVAHTNQSKLASHTYKNSKGDIIDRKVSFAVPVEVIYLTPLSIWNPYEIKEGPFSRKEKAEGSGTSEDPYKSAGGRNWFLTPDSFFSGDEADRDPADTVKAGSVAMETEKHGNVKVRSSGVRIMFPKVEGIEKKIRQRYPIFPIHGQGGGLWKKLNALQDALGLDASGIENSINMKTGISHSVDFTAHAHVVIIEENDYKQLLNGDVESIEARTEQIEGHDHSIEIALDSNNEFYIRKCDKKDEGDKVCFDHHSNTLSEDDE